LQGWPIRLHVFRIDLANALQTFRKVAGDRHLRAGGSRASVPCLLRAVPLTQTPETVTRET
jgi:hypothetical protein